MDNDDMKTKVEADTSQTKRELVARFDVSITVVVGHLKQIGKIKELGPWVTHERNEYPMTRRLEICYS